MRTLALIAGFSLFCLAPGYSFTIPSAEERNGLPPLRIKEVRKVSREREANDESRDHDVKVVLDDHDKVEGVVRWTLAFLKNGENIVSYLEADEHTWGDQKEFVFEMKLEEGAQAIFITAKGAGNNVLAVGMSTIGVPVMDSKLAWVGGSYSPSSSSLRVNPGILRDLQIEDHMCMRTEAPCYILNEELPEVISRCLSVSDQVTNDQVAICDDTTAPFYALAQRPSFNITSDYTLELAVTLPQNEAVNAIEVVAYDPSDPSVVFSPDKFRCTPSAGFLGGTERKCTQRLEMTQEPERMAVLVTVVFLDGKEPESSLILIGEVEPRVQTGAIVGGVVGGLIGLALIVALVLFLLRRNKNKKKGKETSARYDPARTSDPEEA